MKELRQEKAGSEVEDPRSATLGGGEEDAKRIDGAEIWEPVWCGDRTRRALSLFD